MGLGIDLNLLDSLSNGENLEKVQDIFNSLLLNTEEKLGSKPHKTNIRISVMDKEKKDIVLDVNLNDSFDFGVKRSKEDESFIQISITCIKSVSYTHLTLPTTPYV